MSIRPPIPEEVLLFDGSQFLPTPYGDPEEYFCMQEALTAEWLIEQGLMPCPQDIISNPNGRVVDFNRTDIFDGAPYRDIVWVCEDKTK